MKKTTIGLVLVSILLMVPGTTFSARQIPGNVPELAPLQPMPENTTPNISGNIQRASEGPAEEEDENVSETPDALEGLQETLPIPLPKSDSSPWSWLIAVIALVAVGAGVGYLAHIRNKK